MSFSPGVANFVSRLDLDTCSRPLWVYAVTAAPAFLEFWFTVATLDLEDLVRSIGFSESGDDLRKGRRGRRHGSLKLPKGGAHGITRYAALGTRTLLIITLPLEAIGFTMLLYYGADRFFYRWASLLEGIRCEGESRTMMRQNSNFGAFPSVGGGAISLPNLLNSTPAITSNSFGAAVPFGIYEVHLAIEIEGVTPTGGADYSAGIFTVGALGVSLRTGNSVTIKAGQGGTTIFSGTIVMPLFSGGTIGWVLVGPSVPVGVSIASCHCVIHQKGDQ